MMEPVTEINPPLLTSEVARLFGVAPETVRLWERQGHLPARKTESGVRLFDRRDVTRLLEERRARVVAAREEGA
jgi:DNA-binding transcriptional MerR regulator